MLLLPPPLPFLPPSAAPAAKEHDSARWVHTNPGHLEGKDPVKMSLTEQGIDAGKEGREGNGKGGQDRVERKGEKEERVQNKSPAASGDFGCTPD